MNSITINKTLETVFKRIAPSWPLKNFVAVNPFLGFSDTDFKDATYKLAQRGNIKMTMPISFYLEQIKEGGILPSDIRQALAIKGHLIKSANEFIEITKKLENKENSVQWKGICIVDVASEVHQKNWTELMVNNITNWASSYFDEGLATWDNTIENVSIYDSWRFEAKIDRSTEIVGLKGFRKMVKELPESSSEFIHAFLLQLKLNEEEAETYLHSLLLKTIGWSSFISGVDFHNQIYSGHEKNLHDYLAILLAYENYFLNHIQFKEIIRANWYERINNTLRIKSESNEIISTQLILQQAFDISAIRQLKKRFKRHIPIESTHETKAQMVFCIDVRSEVYRRNIENIDPQIETIGFAGFFGFPVNFLPLAHQQGKNQCPVLIPSSALAKESCKDSEGATYRRISNHQIDKTWKFFKSGAVSSFGFVSPLGLSYLPKILLNSFHVTRPVENPKTDGLQKWLKNDYNLDISGISLTHKINMAKNALTAMGIKDQLAPYVFITGHGASSVNNPHASGLDCGACGGHSGEVNALTAQLILNDEEVRKGLAAEGVKIPLDTIFIACLHNTTTDEITIINENLLPNSKASEIAAFKKIFLQASSQTRIERLKRLSPKSNSIEKEENAIFNRASDWAQIRPEWGLAGCNAFIIAPRKRTKGMDLGGKSFLHNYDWKKDRTNNILESIMTAPMVVTSWINLQYYASTTDNYHFGAGNKTLHNVTAGIGVLEGSGGDLRIGLPLQSVHNGKKWEHLPQRLNVIIEAPIPAINNILAKHETIKQLCDNSWIMLHVLNEFGEISHTYEQNLEWRSIEESKEYNLKTKLETV